VDGPRAARFGVFVTPEATERGSVRKLRHGELVELIEGGVPGPGGRWADLGAGEGAFTMALADLLGPEGHIVAIDKDAAALRAVGGGIETRIADFTRPLGLHDLDGVVMANSLHFVRDKAPVLEAVRRMLKADGRLIVVEYGTDRGNPWVPYPFTYQRWQAMATRAGFQETRLLKTVPSRWLGSMYSAVSQA
jgi:ubiquinone/menaquinone biosynthesis C-methylase UbiE